MDRDGYPKGDRVDDMVREWSREHPELDVTALEVTARLLRAGKILQARLDTIASKHGLSHKGDLDVLTALRRSGDPYQLTPTQLAEGGQVTAGGMTIRLDRLEAAEFVARSRSTTDRRGVIVTLTDAGREVADRAFEETLADQARLVTVLSDQDAGLVANGLRALLLALGDIDGRPRTAHARATSHA